MGNLIKGLKVAAYVAEIRSNRACRKVLWQIRKKEDCHG